MYRTCVLSLALALLNVTVAFAQFPQQPPPAEQGDAKERAACRPDVIRYCRAQLAANESDVFGILSCLQRNRSRISRACQNVLTSHGQ